VDELVQVALMGASGRERARAVDAIAYREQPDEGSASRTESVMLSALIDPAHEVRAQALATLKDTADEIPFEALSQVAREDERAAIRIQALELLAERGEERALEPLRIALLDPEDAVRTRARELIGEWHLDTSGSGGT
jgi:HEAT repeat protein